MIMVLFWSELNQNNHNESELILRLIGITDLNGLDGIRY